MTDSHYRLTEDDLVRHLREQVALLTEMGQKFDDGAEMWAMPLATTVRTLVSDTSKKNKSILLQLGVKDGLRYADTTLVPITPGTIAMGGVFVLQATTGPDASVKFVPRGPEQFKLKSFAEWWTMKVTKDARGTMFSRRDFIEHIANQEGGAHVQATLPERYAAISRANSMGMVFETPHGTLIPGNPMLPGVRQIAYELELSLRNQLPDWLGAPPKA